MKRSIYTICLLAFLVLASACQKMERPALGDYPTDTPVEPSTELRFYVPFESSLPNADRINIKFSDSISSYPSFFPSSSITAVEGIRGTAFNSVKGAYLNYLSPNDFVKSSSFTVAFWLKHDSVPVGEAQFVFSIPSSAGHWSNATMFLILDHPGSGATKDLAVLKFFVLDSKGENWFSLENENRMPDIYDNEWHHLAFTYNEATSKMGFYRDGILHHEIEWTGHGALTMDASKVTGLRLGGKTVTDWGESYIGVLDQFRMYNKVLTPTEIKGLFDTKL